MKKSLYKRWWFWALVAWFVWGSVVSRTMNGPTITENKMAQMMGSVVFLLIIVTAIYVLFNPRKKKENKKELRETGPDILARISAHHVEGLPLSEKTFCELVMTPDKLSITGGGTAFSIMIPQLRAAEIKTDTEVANIVNSSAAKGIAGGLLFGPIGLVVGSRAMSKEKRSYTHYLILNYVNSTGEIAAVMFEVDDSDEYRAQEVVDTMKSLITKNPVVTVQL